MALGSCNSNLRCFICKDVIDLESADDESVDSRPSGKMTAVKQIPAKQPSTLTTPPVKRSSTQIELDELKLKYAKLEAMFQKQAASPSEEKEVFTPSPPTNTAAGKAPPPSPATSSSEASPAAAVPKAASSVAAPPSVPASAPASAAAPPSVPASAPPSAAG